MVQAELEEIYCLAQETYLLQTLLALAKDTSAKKGLYRTEITVMSFLTSKHSY